MVLLDKVRIVSFILKTDTRAEELERDWNSSVNCHAHHKAHILNFRCFCGEVNSCAIREMRFSDTRKYRLRTWCVLERYMMISMRWVNNCTSLNVKSSTKRMIRREYSVGVMLSTYVFVSSLNPSMAEKAFVQNAHKSVVYTTLFGD